MLPFRRRPVLVRLMSLALTVTQLTVIPVIAGCGKADLPTEPTASSRFVARSSVGNSGPPVDGETLYRGIFFGDAEFALSVPELGPIVALNQSLDDTRRAALRQYESRIILGIKQIEPDFFSSFAADLRGGNQLAIRTALNRAVRISVRAMNRVPEIANWRARLIENREAVQAELVRLYNAGQLHTTVEQSSAELDVMAAEADSTGDEIKNPGLWFDVAVAVVFAIAIPTFGPAIVVAINAVYAWDTSVSTVTGGGAGSNPSAAFAGSTLRGDRLVEALATRLASSGATTH